MKKDVSSIPQNVPPGALQDALPGLPESEPKFPPPVMILEGHVGEYHVSVPIFSYTVGMAVIDMYSKAARKMKSSAALDLWNTRESWRKEDWASLQTTYLSKK